MLSKNLIAAAGNNAGGSGGPWDIQNATFTGPSSMVSTSYANGTTLYSPIFSADGLYLYGCGPVLGKLVQFKLTTAYDLSTAVFYQAIGVPTTDTATNGFCFKPDGTALYSTTQIGSATYLQKYTLSKAWDIASIDGYQTSTTFISGTGDPISLSVSPDGTTFYYTRAVSSNSSFWYVTFATPWDVTSAASANYSPAFASFGHLTAPYWNADGSKFYFNEYNTRTIYEITVPGAPYDISAVSSSNITAQFSLFDTLGYCQIRGLFITSDGTKFLLGSYVQDRNLVLLETATPFDIANLSLVDSPNSLNLSQFDSGLLQDPYGLVVSTGGDYLYIASSSQECVYQFALSTPYDISTATYVAKFSTNLTTGLKGIAFKPDGTEMYAIQTQLGRIYQYHLGTAWDITTASYQTHVAYPSLGAVPFNISLSEDGTKIYIVTLGSVSDTRELFVNSVCEATLTTPWLISSLDFAGSPTLAPVNTSTFSSEVSNIPSAVCFGNSGNSFYILNGSSPGTIYQYNLSVPYDISSATYASRSYTFPANTDNGYYAIDFAINIDFASDGLSCVVSFSTTSVVSVRYDVRFTLGTAWDVSTLTRTSYGPILYVGAKETAPTAVFMKPDGTKFYVHGSATDNVEQYNLTTPFDLSTAVWYGSSPSFATPETNGAAISIDPLSGVDGKVLTMTGSTADAVKQYYFSTPWDVTSLTTTVHEILPLDEGSSSGLCFANNGYSLYVVGVGRRTIIKYSCPVAYNVNNATLVGESVSLSAFGSASGIYVKNDESIAFIISTSGIVKYQMTTSGDVSTVIPIQAVDIAGYMTQPVDIYFSADGLNMYTATSTQDSAFQFKLSTAWDLHTLRFVGTDYGALMLDMNRRFAPSKYIPGSDVIYGMYNNVWYKCSQTNMHPGSATYPSDKCIPISSVFGSISLTSFGVYGNVAVFPYGPDVGGIINGFMIRTLANDGAITSLTDTVTMSPATSATSTILCATTGGFSAGENTRVGLLETSGIVHFYQILNNNAATISNHSQIDLNTLIPSTGATIDTMSFKWIAFSVGGDKLYASYEVGDTGIIAQFTLITEYSAASGVTLDGVLPFSGVNGLTKVGSYQDIEYLSSFCFSVDGQYLYTISTAGVVRKVTLNTAWDITDGFAGLEEINNFFSGVSISRSTGGGSICVSNDGTTLSIINGGTRTIAINRCGYEFEMSTPHDFDTITYEGTNYGWLNSEPNIGGTTIRFFNNGYKAYVGGFGNTSVQNQLTGVNNNSFHIMEYDLATPYEMSTATYTGNKLNTKLGVDALLNLSAANPVDVNFEFSSDGTILVFVGEVASSDATGVFQFTLSTPWDISTAVCVASDKLVLNAAGASYAVKVKPDGTRLYVARGASYYSDSLSPWTSMLVQYDMSSPHDINSASLSGVSSGVVPPVREITAMDISDDGTKTYILDFSTNQVLQFDN